MQTRLTVFGLSALLFGVSACSTSASDPSGGAVGSQLQVAPGTTVTLAQYTIEGPNDFASAGTVAVGTSADVPVSVSHLPAGLGYVMQLSATASDGVTECSGSTTFDIADSAATSTVVVQLTCAVPSGDVEIAATLNICPMVDGLDAAPNALKLGGSATLTATAHDTDNGPAPLAYSWKINGSKLAKQTAPTLKFTCTTVGDVTIAAVVSDGDPSPSCADSLDVQVGCQ